MPFRTIALVATFLAPAAGITFSGSREAARGDSALEHGANPIRKVVTLLQAMQKKVEEEGEKEEALYKKYECYCATGGEDLTKSISELSTKAPAVSADIEEKESRKTQLEEDLKQHQADRDAAKQAVEQATAIREKEAAAFATEKADYDSNIEALVKAISAITRGMAGGFLQTSAAQVLRKLVASQDMNDPERQELMAFLANKDGYVPSGGEITGILQQIKEDMEKGLADSTAAESTAIASFEELKAAKTKEIEALTQSIEEKSQRVGELAVAIVTAKNDLTDTQKSLLEDQKFFADLQQNCDKKKQDWEERSKTRAEELSAISETISVLNSDDALDLFKKTLPSAASSSLVQLVRGGQSAAIRTRALAALGFKAGAPRRTGTFDLDFIALAIQGKKVGFEKVLKMIDEMVESLKAEQVEDDKKKEYCAAEFDTTEDKKKALDRSMADQETAIAEAESGISALKEEIEALTASMAELDKSVAEAGSQRKQEHSEFMQLISENSAAKDVLNFAINRLNKFYNPKLHVPEPEAPASSLQVSGNRVDPGPAPETFGDYETKTGESAGVISMIKTLIKDLDKEMTEAEASEENSQQEYAELMKDATEKKATDTEALTGKKASLAAMESEFEDHKEAKTSTGKELDATTKYLQALHSECDWMIQYYEVRKEARASEVDSLKNAKAVLSGADFSFSQRSERRVLLRGR